MDKHSTLYKYYEIVITILAIISVSIVLLDYSGRISITKQPYSVVDNTILVIFAIDYFARFFRSKTKWNFFKSNIFDLLAIIPFNAVFSFFRLARLFRITRIFRITRLLRLTRLVGLLGKLTRNARDFLNTNGLIYWLYISGTVLVLSAGLYSYSESINFGDALWWAIVTSTTVGYGDLSPHTWIGRIAAVLLMIIGIGLISMVTGSITTFFTRDKPKDDDSKLDTVIQENRELKEELQKLTVLVKSLQKQDAINHAEEENKRSSSDFAEHSK